MYIRTSLFVSLETTFSNGLLTNNSTNARSRRSFKHYNDYKGIDSSERSSKLVACDRRIVTGRKSQVTTNERKTDEQKGFADDDSDCEKRAVKYEEIFDWDSNGITEEKHLANRERRIKEFFISHVGACKDMVELFTIMATVSDITDVFSNVTGDPNQAKKIPSNCSQIPKAICLPAEMCTTRGQVKGLKINKYGVIVLT